MNALCQPIASVKAGTISGVTTAPTFALSNEAGLRLQAAEQRRRVALARELLAADALCDGRLVRLSPISITHEDAQPYHLVYPPNLRDWPPLASFRDWLRDEIDASLSELHPPAPKRKARKAA